MENKRNAYSTATQKLISLLQSDDELRSGKFSSTFTTKEAYQKWQEIEMLLNNMLEAKKPWKMWRKTQQDLQCKIKAKVAKINKDVNTNGGGPLGEELSQIGQIVMTIHLVVFMAMMFQNLQ
ncbi:hypothetical protein EVAR_12576_1 [Eumeta japonica]|uniref:Regulatory protein zeste n=1 Tax=Eumeta variegata TaxID=151549 RepID=A0A4C1UG08_EUMVA|nr:hypothetical protein EVAR_12576_1 [Eumeta japonica]